MRKRESGAVHGRESDCTCVYIGKVMAGGVGMPWKWLGTSWLYL